MCLYHSLNTPFEDAFTFTVPFISAFRVNFCGYCSERWRCMFPPSKLAVPLALMLNIYQANAVFLTHRAGNVICHVNIHIHIVFLYI